MVVLTIVHHHVCIGRWIVVICDIGEIFQAKRRLVVIVDRGHIMVLIVPIRDLLSTKGRIALSLI